MHNSTAVAVRNTVVPFAEDSLSEAIRNHIRAAILKIANEEMSAFLGASFHARVSSRFGYRNGSARERTLTTSVGPIALKLPRARLFDGSEWQSTMIPRYSRRTREVEAALMGLYFGGVNTRKVRQAIRPLLRNAPLSKSSISRLIVRLKEFFDGWASRSLAEEDIRYVYLDGTYVRLRCAGRRGSLPVMVAVGVRSTGEKVLLALRVMGSESGAAWEAFVRELADRGLKRPELAITDGNQGLALAIDKVWPNLPRQRCVVHKLWNLLGHTPKSRHDELKADYGAIVYAEDLGAAKHAYEAFVRKWRRMNEGVVRSIQEAGEELLTFMTFPKAQWKAIRTTNIIERLNQEFRRRVKTQGMFPTESSILVLLFGVVASGMVRLRKIEGFETMGQAGKLPVQALAIA